MNRAAKLVICLALASTTVLPQQAQAGAPALDAAAKSAPVGAVYVASNAFSGNEIITFPRLADGTLLPARPGVATGGLGSGPGLIPGVDADPLGSQDSLVVDQANQRLFAVNAGSNDVSVFDITRDGLTLVDRSPTTGQFPVSLTVDDSRLYVLNALGGSVDAFSISAQGRLAHRASCALPGLPAGGDGPLIGDATHSTQPVITQSPGQIGLSPDGQQLLVVSKEGPLLQGFPLGSTLGNGRIHVYDVRGSGARINNCARPTTTTLPTNADSKGKFPFSFTWSRKGQLLLTEVFGVGTSFVGSAVSSFNLQGNGSLSPISTSVGNGQTAVCWIVVSGKNAYVANHLSHNISSFAVANDGVVSLTEAAASGTAAGVLDTPIDMAATTDGRFIYQLSPGSATVVPFAVDRSSGALTKLPAASDSLVPRSGQAGIATVDFTN